MPINVLTAATFSRCGDGALLRTLCTSGSKSVHSSGPMCSSEVIARNIRRSYLPRRSTAPLLHGQ